MIPMGGTPRGGWPGASLGVPERWEPAGVLAVDRAETLRYLGYKGQPLDPGLSARIERAADELPSLASPVGVLATFGTDARVPDGGGTPLIHLEGSTIDLAGWDVFRHLKDARWVAVVAATLGMGLERELRLAAGQRPLEAAVLDAAASSYIETAVQAMNDMVDERARAAGLFTTWRFSPGYGDLPLDAQGRIVGSLNATRLIGLTVTPTSLLMPTKSVTALIGVFEEPRPSDDRPRCGSCRLRGECAFRARGETCYAPRGSS